MMASTCRKFALFLLISLYLSEYSEGTQESHCGDRVGDCLDEPEVQNINSSELGNEGKYPGESLIGSNYSAEVKAVVRGGIGLLTSSQNNQKRLGPLKKLPEWIIKVANLIPNTCGIKKQLVGPTPATYVYGGTYTQRNEFPWMARLLWDTGSTFETFCAGSLITDRHVLTAGHCLLKREPIKQSWVLRYVQLGNWDSRFDPVCFVDTLNPWRPEMQCAVGIPIVRTFLHENFRDYGPSMTNDIALLQLGSPVKPNDRIRPICLPETAKILPNLYAAGWGKTEAGQYSTRLIKVELPLFDIQYCAIFYPNVTTGNMCAGGKRGKDTCDGDSGGPLVQLGQFISHQYEIVGITSYGSPECGAEGIPGVYTRVYHYLPWILNKIRFSVDP